MRALDRGEALIVMRNGAPVGERTPVRARQFVTAEIAVAAFAGAPAIAAGQFRADVDAVLDHDTTWGRLWLRILISGACSAR